MEKPTHLLVDFENVQPTPDELRAFFVGPGEAWVFHNATHEKLLPPLRATGVEVTCVPTARQGKNSLDFHLVLYLGYLASRNGHCRFVVLSGDKGYDPAIEHARILGLDVVRRETLGATALKKKVPTAKTKASKSATKKSQVSKKSAKKVPTAKKAPAPRVVKTVTPSIMERVTKDLREHPENRPSTLKSLERHVNTLLGHNVTPEALKQIISRLERSDLINTATGKLRYNAV